MQLVDQLAPGGRIIIPVGPEGGDQYLEQIDKGPGGKVTRTKLVTQIRDCWHRRQNKKSQRL